MLTVPATIQTLFKTDSVRKNFRVHFPNGENADLTNSDIISGSVRFTESVCSKDVLQFGLAEASRIEFECVNVQNIYGMTIECGIEVDTSSLSAAQISAIQGDPGDGTLVLVGDSDIGYGFYRVPYGVFTVTSCPRSAGAMWKRKVEAYAPMSSLEIASRTFSACQFYPSEMIVYLIPLAMCALNSDYGFSMTQTGYALSTSSLQYVIPWTYNSVDYRLRITGDWKRGTNVSNMVQHADSPMKAVCTADMSNHAQIYETLNTYGISGSAFNEAKTLIQPSIIFADPGADYYGGVPFTNPEDSGFLFAPYFTTTTILPTISFPVDLTVKFYVAGSEANPIETWTLTGITSDQHEYVYTLSSDLALMKAKIPATFQDEDTNRYVYLNPLDPDKIAEGFLELNAQFGAVGRDGTLAGKYLSKSSPISMDTDEYMALWWDEYDISSIGAIKLSYHDVDLNADQSLTYDTGGGLSEYDMTDNYLLKNLAVSVNDLTNQTVEEFVTGLLDTYFIPNITDIAFTPVQLDALGLPYLEAGDYLEIDDGNSGTVGTYIMNRTISGEQFLEDEIESQGGEIIGNARAA